jgi:hypothetical protein
MRTLSPIIRDVCLDSVPVSRLTAPDRIPCQKKTCGRKTPQDEIQHDIGNPIPGLLLPMPQKEANGRFLLRRILRLGSAL